MLTQEECLKLLRDYSHVPDYTRNAIQEDTLKAVCAFLRELTEKNFKATLHLVNELPTQPVYGTAEMFAETIEQQKEKFIR